MGKYLILEVVLNMPRHHNEGLPDKVEKHSAQERHNKDQPRIHYDAEGEDMEKDFLKIEVLKGAVHLDVIDHKIDRMPDKQRRNDLERI
jgi:hypothetical protein